MAKKGNKSAAKTDTPLSTEDITLISFPVKCNARGQKIAEGYRIYYYQGNIFRPLETPGSDAGAINGAINRFVRSHADLIKRDRESKYYRTLMELCDVPPPPDALPCSVH